ncbi:MAG: SDR family oxidoreductase [Bacteroidetes bacterium]|nr:SDR family oxidoreductase [Bacteroidota bacterium]MDA1121659.1 SDR family oxidoreductase [Bacteroidota bacterium]
MDISISGKRAIVCGSTQGIGKAAAKELASLGANILLIARNEDSLKVVLDELPKNQEQRHDYLVADFQQPEILKDKINIYLQDNSAEILINNTGGPPGGPIIDADYHEFEKAMTAHLTCSHILVQALVPGMKASKYGRIINIISTSVKIPIPGLGVSNTTRGAMASWAKTLSQELAPFGITVNNVLPGFTSTGRLDSLMGSIASKRQVPFETVRDEMIASVPAGRFGTPEEIANLIGFLATPAAAYISGTSIQVDGARTGAL